MRCWLSIVLLFYGLLSPCMVFAELHDPTQPGDLFHDDGNGASQVSVILISPTRRLAVIHGVFVHIGSVIDGAKVISINPNSVQLEGDKGVYTLFLIDPNIRRSE